MSIPPPPGLPPLAEPPGCCVAPACPELYRYNIQLWEYNSLADAWEFANVQLGSPSNLELNFWSTVDSLDNVVCADGLTFDLNSQQLAFSCGEGGDTCTEAPRLCSTVPRDPMAGITMFSVDNGPHFIVNIVDGISTFSAAKDFVMCIGKVSASTQVTTTSLDCTGLDPEDCLPVLQTSVAETPCNPDDFTATCACACDMGIETTGNTIAAVDCDLQVAYFVIGYSGNPFSSTFTLSCPGGTTSIEPTGLSATLTIDGTPYNGVMGTGPYSGYLVFTLPCSELDTVTSANLQVSASIEVDGCPYNVFIDGAIPTTPLTPCGCP